MQGETQFPFSVNCNDKQAKVTKSTMSAVDLVTFFMKFIHPQKNHKILIVELYALTLTQE